MKLNRIKLRQLIIEVLTEGSHKYMVTTDDQAYTMDQAKIAKLTGRTLDAMSTGKHPNLGPLKKADPDYARTLATDSEFQPGLTQIEIGAQSLPDSEFSKPDTQLKDYSLSKSMEIIKHLKRECQEPEFGYDCTIKDEREFDPDDPFIAVHITGDANLPSGGEGAVDYSVHLSDMSGIDIYDNLQRGIFDPYDYYSIHPNPFTTDANFKPRKVAEQIIDIVWKASDPNLIW